MELELHADAGALLGRLTAEQRQRLDALDAAYIELLSSDRAPAKAEVEALADVVVAFYDEIPKTGFGHENGVI
ncbi:hypothetical protein HFC70_20025 [Agrobacterium sp. a22-2]|uniref:hypothetical protein n=1 Tax=Agrobacterium TaxID=357 RepID=UPI000D19FA90|nr:MULTISPECIES: hypothetical protein [Agrobacterium]NKN38642.1 hypothetical protein [Agrobacterium sp. a22-2]